MVADIWLGDASAMARVLMRCPPARRQWVLCRMLTEANRAAAHRIQQGAAHPIWGNGSVMAVALRRPRAPEPSLGSPEFIGCLTMVLQRISGPCRP